MWKKYLSYGGKFNKKSFIKAQKYMDEDMGMIIQALGLIDKINDERQFEMSQFDPTGSSYVGCIAYEFPE